MTTLVDYKQRELKVGQKVKILKNTGYIIWDVAFLEDGEVLNLEPL